MPVALCTTCKGRTPHLSRTLPQNLKDNPESKCVVLDYNDQDSLAAYLRTNHTADMESGRLVVYQYRAPVPFRMAHAKNLAHRLGLLEGGDILVNIDADNFTGAGFGSYVADQFKDCEDVFLWGRMIKGQLPRGISGRIAVNRTGFLMSGGYDEQYHTHSPDDKDFNARLRRLGFQGREIDNKFLLAILHNDKVRYREYPTAAAACEEDFAIDHGKTVVNAGSVGCGVVFRNFSDEPIDIKPLPSRIFGIGLHKTATTSLHTALTMLGIRSAHWRTAHWAKSVWREMNESGRSHSLERCYAVSDLPIPLLFRKLDAAYPGSKFILTMRDEDQWLASVEKHFSYQHNKFRTQWDNDPFSHRIHRVLYGRTDFERATFLARYRRHNAEVMEYFRHRPSDLLVLDVGRGQGWPELCSFLQVPIPSVPYPRIYASAP